MRLGGRLAAAGEVLRDVVERRRPVADALKDWGLSHRFAGSGDRAAIGNIAYDALRRRRSIACAMNSDEPEALAEGALYVGWGETPGTLRAKLEGDRFAPPPRGDYDPMRLERAEPAIRADVPNWTVEELQATYGENWEAETRALAGRPPLDLRVNTLKSRPDAVAVELKRFGAVPIGHVPNGLRIAPPERDGRTPNVTSEASYRKGHVEVQDAGSQLVARLAVPKGDGGQVLDWCAGAGGKTLAIAAAMNNRGQIHAHDVDRHRLAPIHERLSRAGARNVQVWTPDGDFAAHEGTMDVVLVDAPCSGSGTWRRRPDAKWRLRETSLEVRHREQDEALRDAARFVRPGGTLVYVTCSVFASENGARVAAFLADHPGFEAVGAVGHDENFDLAPKHTDKAGGAILSPLTSETDGFYAQVLRRTS